MAYESMMMSDAKWALLIEDDCVFSPDFLTVLSDVLPRVPSDAYGLYCGGEHQVPPAALTDDLVVVRGAVRTHCILYKVSKLAEIYIEMTRNARSPDQVLRGFHRTHRFYGVRKHIAAQGTLRSTIGRTWSEVMWWHPQEPLIKHDPRVDLLPVPPPVVIEPPINGRRWQLWSPAEIRYLCFEVGTTCNLAGVHSRCPINEIPRDPQATALTPESIVEFAAYMVTQGFRGHIAFHFYNEPLLELDKVLETIGKIKQRMLPVKFNLWTNGKLIPRDPEKASYLADFDEVVWSAYSHEDAAAARELRKTYSHIVIRESGLDLRREHKDLPDNVGPGDFGICHRQDHELIVRNDGTVIHCCADFKNTIQAGNVLRDTPADILSNWRVNKTRVARGGYDAIGLQGLPLVCKACHARNPRMKQF
jgi:hypothetical protein